VKEHGATKNIARLKMAYAGHVLSGSWGIALVLKGKSMVSEYEARQEENWTTVKNGLTVKHYSGSVKDRSHWKNVARVPST